MDNLRTIIKNRRQFCPDSYIGFTELHHACVLGLPDCVKLILATGDNNVNALADRNYTPLHIACDNNESLECIQILIAAGADVNAQSDYGWTPLHSACQGNDKQLVQILLEAGADPSIKTYRGILPHQLTDMAEIKDLIENFGLDGGCSTKAAI